MIDIPSLRKGHPENKDKLEGVVEGCKKSVTELITYALLEHTEPIHSINRTFEDGQEGVGHPVLSDISSITCE